MKMGCIGNAAIKALAAQKSLRNKKSPSRGFSILAVEAVWREVNKPSSTLNL